MKKIFTLLTVCSMLIMTASVGHAKANKIKDGKTVQIDYTLTVDGNVIETTDGKTPLKYVVGTKNLVPGLAKALKGLKEGDKKQIVVKPKDAFGEFNQNAIQELSRSVLPPAYKPVQGDVLQLAVPGKEGTTSPCMIWEVRENTVVLNFNHPLAGKELKYDVKVVKVE